MRVTQINLQSHFGGGEVYTAFLCRALNCLGVSTTLYAHPEASFWGQLSLPESTIIVRATNGEAIAGLLPRKPLWLLSHGPQPKQILAASNPQWLLTAVAHMPLQGRNPHSFDGHDMVFPVSDWVRTGLLDAGAHSWNEPLYGVAAINSLPEKSNTTIVRNSRYDWDKRKFRDRLFGLLQPLAHPLFRQITFEKRSELTLGIVSRLTTIKQFPLLFSHLAPVLARFPTICLEVFGSGGYASVRDLSRALVPITDRVRFWGHQRDVSTVFGQLDYLLTGLPEKEALGLNVIEAQALNLPVLAVNAPPFTETISDGITGFFYRDPREDDGDDFSLLLDRLLALPSRLQPIHAVDHLSRFSFDSFVARLQPIVTWAKKELQQ